MGVCPILVYLLHLNTEISNWIAAGVFLLASLTDWLDGYFARKFNVVSNLGKFMDPIADKILVASVLIMLIPDQRIGPILVLLLLARDILIGGIRSVAAADRLIIDAKAAGKWKTGLQMVSIPAILIGDSLASRTGSSWPIYNVGLSLLWFSVVLSIFSGLQYILLYFHAKRSEPAP